MGMFAEAEQSLTGWFIAGGAGMIIAWVAARIIEVWKTKGIDLPVTCKRIEEMHKLIAKTEALRQPILFQKLEKLENGLDEINEAIKAFIALEEERANK